MVVAHALDNACQKGSVGIVQTCYFTFASPPDEMTLDSGNRLGPVTLAYETYGRLNEDRSNAILILHALSGDAHVAGYHSPTDNKPGWWESMVGPGKGFDTDRYFVICSNVIGGCQGSTGPSSFNPRTGRPYGLDFPILTIADMVRAQVHLIEYLGVDRLLCVAGGSMGGMQAIEWATRYPDRMQSTMVIASSYFSNAQAIAFNAVGRHAIVGDSAFREGQYAADNGPAKGLGVARMLAHITYLSQESMHAKFGRALRYNNSYKYDFGSEFSVETYLDYQGEQFTNRFDANSYLYITKALDYFDLTTTYGSLDAAMARVACKVLVLSFSSDWLYPPAESQTMVYALTRQKKDVTYCNIESSYGHDAFLLEVDVMERIISGFLKNLGGAKGDCIRRALCPKTVESESSAHGHGIYQGRRVDYEHILDIIDEHSSVLDIGCGNGTLLCNLSVQKRVNGMGIEVSQESVVNCVECGISVLQADADCGLAGLPDQSVDCVVLSMTLQEIQKPETVIREMLRVGRKCIVSFPNFAHWQNRLKTMFRGRSPVSPNLPFAWFNTPNRHFLSIVDFREFCKLQRASILREIPLLSSGGEVRTARIWPNFFADESIFVLSQKPENMPSTSADSADSRRPLVLPHKGKSQ